MFGDDERPRELAENALELFDLEDLLEMNDLSDVDVIEILIRQGRINTYDDGFETEDDDT